MEQIEFNSSIVSDNDLYNNGYLLEDSPDGLEVLMPRDGDFLHDDLSRVVKVILGILYSLFCIGAFLGNTCVLIVIVTNRSLRTVTNTFILSLTVSDILISCWNMPMQLIFYLKNEWTFGATVCKMTSFVQGISIATSIFALAAISIERYRVICNPIKARFIRSTKSAILMSISIWIVAIVIMLPQLWIQRLQQRLSWQLDKYPPIRIVFICVEYFPKFSYNVCYSFWFFLVLYVLPVVVMTYAYGKMANVLWLRSHMGEQVISSQLSDSREVQRKNIIRMLMVIVLCYIICWMPFFAMHIIILFIDFTDSVRVIQAFALLSGYSNSFINPLIYFFLNAKLKRVFKTRFSGLCKRNEKKNHISLKPMTQITQT